MAVTTDVGVEVGGFDGGAGNAGAGRIGDLARDQGPELLCTGKRTKEHDKRGQTETHINSSPAATLGSRMSNVYTVSRPDAMGKLRVAHAPGFATGLRIRIN